MKPLRNRLLDAKAKTELPWEVMERDYILSWILAGITQVPALKNNMIFKGGTALKKCYFGDYRMSEDLDFTGLSSVPRGNELQQAIQDSCEIASKLLNEYAPVEFTCERYIERNPHPRGQEAFVIKAKLPWHRQPHVRIMIEITMDEPVFHPPIFRSIFHSYGEKIDCEILTYSLNEIIAEKLRAILQQEKLLEQRGWVRSRARDYYDLWRILNTYKNHLDLNEFPTFLAKKCEVRQVQFKNSNDFFPEKIIQIVTDSWEQWLKPLIRNLPECNLVISLLRNEIKCLLDE